MQHKTIPVVLTCFTLFCLDLYGQQQGGDTQSNRQENLARFDENGDGRLSQREFEVAAEALGFMKTMTWMVDETEREALVLLPRRKRDGPSPLVFVFHGFGGTAQEMARGTDLHRRWQEAIVIYMQGLPMELRSTGETGHGWQPRAEVFDDRDLRFFDEVLATCTTDHAIDEDRIYATGYSLGGRFTYLLWCERPNLFAAIAPCASFFPGIVDAEPTPVAVLHIGGDSDNLAPLEKQRDLLRRLREVNCCENDGKSWEELGTLFPSATDTPLVEYIYDGGHGLPKNSWQLIVRFFQQNTRRLADN